MVTLVWLLLVLQYPKPNTGGSLSSATCEGKLMFVTVEDRESNVLSAEEERQLVSCQRIWSKVCPHLVVNSVMIETCWKLLKCLKSVIRAVRATEFMMSL